MTVHTLRSRAIPRTSLLRAAARPAQLLALSALLVGCSVSTCLSSGEILEELDEIVRINDTDGNREIAYARRAKVSSWYMHHALFAPIRAPMALLFGRRTEMALENPGSHVRELLRELPDETGGDLVTCAAATSRFGWLAELDNNPETRVLAIDGLSRVCRQLQIKPFAGSFVEMSTPLAGNQLELARASIRSMRPSARPDGQLGSLEGYRDALVSIVSRPLADWQERLLLVEDLGALLVREVDAQARPHVDEGLRAAIGHCVRGILLSTIKGRYRRFAEVRLCAMEQVRRLGGPRTVPLMLAAMAATPLERTTGVEPYDPDTLVQLRLIHYCGQLSGDLAHAVVHLPGRQEWEASSAAEYLARIVLSETDYYSKLRTPAIVALTWCLGRDKIDPSPEWVRAWTEAQS